MHYFADVLMNKRTKSYCFIMTVLLKIPVHLYERERETEREREEREIIETR